MREDVENDEVNDHFQHHLSYTSSPDGWNRSPAFPQSQRLGIASASSFLGTNYHSKFTIPGPGMHEVSQSTMELKNVSLTRSSDWSRRWRNCRPLQGHNAKFYSRARSKRSNSQPPPRLSNLRTARRPTRTATTAARRSLALPLVM